MPNVRIVGLDVDGTLANTAKQFRDYAVRYGADLTMQQVRERGGISGAYAPLLKPEEMNDCLQAPWRDPGAVDLTHPRIPDYLSELQNGPYHYVFVGVTSSKGDIDNIKGWLRAKDIPHEGVLHTPRQRDKRKFNIHLQFDDSATATASFVQAGLPVIFIETEINALRIPEVAKHESVFPARWPEVPKLLSSNPALIRNMRTELEPALRPEMGLAIT